MTTWHSMILLCGAISYNGWPTNDLSPTPTTASEKVFTAEGRRLELDVLCF